MSPETKAILRSIHRMGGLLVAAFVLFYSVTGIMLNHRKGFGYFYRIEESEAGIPREQDKRISKFIEHYKGLINREDNPTVIKIKDEKTIELLYGSHGLTRYVIKPEEGRVIKKEKVFLEPLNRLNNLLHKAVNTGSIWIYLSDIFSGVLILSTVTGLFIFRYKKLDVALLLIGTLLISLFSVTL